MAGYRQIHTKIWKDEFFIDLDPVEKLLFIYLFSNELATITGMYSIPLRVISNETGIDKDTVRTTLDKFENAGKIKRDDGILWVVNMQTYNANPGPTVKTKIQRDLASIPDSEIKNEYLKRYPADTLPIPSPYPTDTPPIPQASPYTRALTGASTESPALAGTEACVDTLELSPVQLMIEKVTGLPPMPSDVKVMDEIAAMNPTQEDIQAAYDWYIGQGKKFRYYSSLVGPIRTARAKRIQEGNSPPKTTKTAVIQDHNKRMIEKALERNRQNGNV